MFGELESAGIYTIAPAFAECIIGHARVERLWTGARWCVNSPWNLR